MFSLALVAIYSGCGLFSADQFDGLRAKDTSYTGASGSGPNAQGGCDSGPHDCDELQNLSGSLDGPDPAPSDGGSAGDSAVVAGAGATPTYVGFERCARDSGTSISDGSVSVAESIFSIEDFGGWVRVPGAPDGGVWSSRAAAASRSAGTTYLFARGNDGGLWQNFGVALAEGVTWSWIGWKPLSLPATPMLGALSATIWREHSLAVVARATTPFGVQAYVRVCAPPTLDVGQDGIWTSWGLIDGGNLVRDPTIAFSDDKLFVFAVGTDQQLYFTSNDTTIGFDSKSWTLWQFTSAGALASEASVAARPGGALFVASLSNDGHLLLLNSGDYGNKWSSWRTIDSGEVLFSYAPALAIAPTASGSLTIFGTGTDGQMWTSRSTDDGATWESFQASPHSRLTAAPAAVSPQEGVVHTFARGTDSVFG